MPRIGSLFADFKLNIGGFVKGLKTVDRNLKAVSKNFANLGKSLSTKITLPLAGLGAAALKASVDIEKVKISMTNLTGSADKANKIIGELQTLAASTPFQFAGLAKGARNMLAFGFEAKKVAPAMANIVDAVSAVGGGNFEIERLVRALGQIGAKGKVAAQEINQIAELGLPIRQVLADGLGVTVAELEKMQRSGIEAKKAIDLILEGFGERFEGSAEKLSQSLGGLFSTLRDNGQLALAELGNEIAKTFDLKTVTRKATGFLKGLTNSFKSMTDESRKGIVRLAGTLAATGPLLVGIGAAITGIKALGAAMIALATGGAARLTLGLNVITFGFAALAIHANGADNAVKQIANSFGFLGVKAGEFFTSGGFQPIVDLFTFQGFSDIANEQFRRTANFAERSMAEIRIEAENARAELDKLFEDAQKGARDLEESLKDLKKATKDIGEIATGPTIPGSILNGNKDFVGPELPKTGPEILPEDLINELEELQTLATKNFSAFGDPLDFLNEKLINVESTILDFNENIKGNSAESRAALQGLIEDHKNLTIALQEEQLTQETLAITQENAFGSAKEALRDFAAEVATLGQSIGSIFGQVFTGLVDGFARSTAQAIVMGQKFGDSMKNVGKQVVAALIQDLIKLGIERLTQSVIAATAGQVALTARMGQLAAETYGAAFAATAAIPLVGPALAPAAASAAVAGMISGSIASKATGIAAFAALAEGGIVTKPTLSLIGEGGEPEVVFPLSKLQRFLGAGFSGAASIIQILLDGEVLAESTAQHLPGVFERQGLRA